MNEIKFSILIPSIPSRITRFLYPLLERIYLQIGSREDIEVLCFIDNKKRSVGRKRDALVQMSQGNFLAFVDDDDDILEGYIYHILKTIENNVDADIIVFDQKAIINKSNYFTVRFGVEYENQEAYVNNEGIWQDITRKPFHVCVWRSEIAKKHRFPDASYGEDWHWAQRALNDVKRQVRINETLHLYTYDDAITEAELIFPK